MAHPVLRRVYELYTNPFDTDSPKESSTAISGDVRLRQRVTFDLYFAPIFLFALHGISALKVLGILYTNYKIAKTLPKKYIPAATWVFNISTLFANELCQGYPFERVAALFVSPTGPEGHEAALVLWGRYLDSFGGLLPRWEILFNITVLRLISFNMDYYWSFNYPSSSPIEVSHSPQHTTSSI